MQMYVCATAACALTGRLRRCSICAVFENHSTGYEMVHSHLGRSHCLVVRSDILISSLELVLNRRDANLGYEDHRYWYPRFANVSYKLQATSPFRSLLTSYNLRARAAVSL